MMMVMMVTVIVMMMMMTIVIVILMMRMVLLLVDEIHSNDWPDVYFYVPILILDNIHQVKELVSTASLGIKHQKEKISLTELDCEGLPVCQQDILAW